MHGPATVGWLLVALCALTGVSCLLRARGAVAPQRRAAGSEALMGFGMAVMAVPATPVRTAPPAVFAALFAAAAAWELVLAREHFSTRRGSGHHMHHLHHALGALAMVYMALAMPGAGAGHHHATTMETAGVPLLTGALLAYFAAYVLGTGARLMTPGGAVPGAGGTASAPDTRPGTGRVRDEPAFALACRLAMGTGMFAMLVTL
ncbi:DUF5134 domain-containing protein [Streptomyces sp. ODS28]|uniref:DUF5134 domain-containing protein n=1 Tax=Streptomyces sp. ODS28 TaxID=3136688 RepID=UPI0031E6CF51